MLRMSVKFLTFGSTFDKITFTILFIINSTAAYKKKKSFTQLITVHMTVLSVIY